MKGRAAIILASTILASSSATAIEPHTAVVHVAVYDSAENAIAARIAKVNRKRDAAEIAKAIVAAAKYYEIDPLLVAAVVEVESAYDPRAVGPIGERGLMQIRKSTAKDLGLNWADAFLIEENIWAGTKYLSWHLADYGSVAKAASRYNGGSSAYAAKVMLRYNRMALAQAHL